jgi:hypothetical protein
MSALAIRCTASWACWTRDRQPVDRDVVVGAAVQFQGLMAAVQDGRDVVLYDAEELLCLPVERGGGQHVEHVDRDVEARRRGMALASSEIGEAKSSGSFWSDCSPRWLASW